MSFITSTLFLLSTLVATAVPATNKSSELSEPMCYDWGESRLEEVLVVEGEVGWLSCPLFSHPSVYNYSSTPSAGHNLVWYRHPEGHDLEQPITYSPRLSKDRERLWLQPAAVNDSGNYICMLRNKSSCSKMARRLRVLRLDEAVQESICQLPVAAATTQVVVPLQGGKVLDCPDVQDAAKMADSPPTVTWWHSSTDKLTHYSRCYQSPLRGSDRQQKGVRLHIHLMMENYQGLYYCRVQYQRREEMLHFTRVINVTAVQPNSTTKEPYILQPTKDQAFTVRQDSDVQLVCKAMFPYLGTPWDIWWTVDGKTVEQLANQRFSNKSRLLTYDFGDWTVENVLLIRDFESGDLNRKYNCSVRNERGFDTRRAQLEELVWLPSVELACGLVVTLLLMLLLFVVYHVFWLELLLLYRSWFGTDERHTDDKEYDVYISYARNSEEEQFVLSTLRRVLENDLGYTVCIFDRDSLPGGTITDETLSFVARSRRLLVVVSPGYASQGSQALLELKAGIDGIMGGHLRVIVVQYKPFRRQDWVRELRRARVALALVRWQGDKSNKLTSRFWKRLKVELPVRRDSTGEEKWGGKDMGLMRLHSQNSTSSQTGLITHTLKDPQTILNSAA